MKHDNEYVNRLSKKNILGRALWNICCLIFFRPFPSKLFNPWRNFVLKIFGAKISKRAGVYSSAQIYCPWNLILDRNAWIGPNAICYNVAVIHLEENVTVSQNAHLCTASHNIYSKEHELTTSPILVKKNAWIAADAFVGMGVTIGEGAVVGARAAVYKNVEPWTIVGGNPAKFIKKRIIKD